jgi:hypothetical protein
VSPSADPEVGPSSAGAPRGGPATAGSGTSHRRLRLLAHATRVALAALVATLVSEALGMSATWFAAIAAIVAMQSTLRSSVRSAVTSVVGAVFGTVIGIGGALLGWDQAWAVAVVVVITIGFPSLFGRPQVGQQAALVAVVILLMPSHEGSVIVYAMNRLLQSVIGVVVALVVQLTVFPPRAYRKLARELGSIYRTMAASMERVAAELEHRTDPGARPEPGPAEDVASVVSQEVERLEAIDSLWEEALSERGSRDLLAPAWAPTTRHIWEHCAVLETDVTDVATSPLLTAVAGPAVRLATRLGESMGTVAAALEGEGDWFDAAALTDARDELLAAARAEGSAWSRTPFDVALRSVGVIDAMDVICDELLRLHPDRDGAEHDRRPGCHRSARA